MAKSNVISTKIVKRPPAAAAPGGVPAEPKKPKFGKKGIKK
jgi:hypothetical protein